MKIAFCLDKVTFCNFELSRLAEQGVIGLGVLVWVLGIIPDKVFILPDV